MKLVLLAIGLLAVRAAGAVPVIGIQDGDSLTLLEQQRPLKVRLAFVDAPEKSQDHGMQARKSLSDLCFGRDAQYRTVDTDRYGRTVAEVICDGVNVNRAQVARGYAWVYTLYNRDAGLPGVEAKARQEKLGLWRDDHPTPPWEYRRTRRDAPK